MVTVALFGVIGFVMEKQRLSGGRDGPRHRHGHDGGAELRHLADQVGRLGCCLSSTGRCRRVLAAMTFAALLWACLPGRATGLKLAAGRCA